jgi:hypothetical protein
MKATAIPKAITAPNMIASIHGDVIRTLGPVRYCECEVLHTASNIFIGHKTPILTRQRTDLATCDRGERGRCLKWGHSRRSDGQQGFADVRYAFNGDRICASQQTDAMCQ